MTTLPGLGNNPRSNLWQLPDVLEVSASRVRYPEPKLYYANSQLREAREAVEFLIATAAELPARALSPALFVGEQAILDYETAAMNRYRFFAFDFENLQPGAPIAIGWPQLPQEQRIRTNFLYQLPNTPIA